MKSRILLTALIVLLLHTAYAQLTKNRPAGNQIDLSGKWSFQIDSLDKGVSEQWFSKTLPDNIQLPGSMTTNGKGNDITLHTPWTGGIVDSSWFYKPEYAKYRQPGNIKVPFWLQPVKYYKGAAWYQKTVTIPADWKGKYIELFIERSHWETSVWIDNKPVGMRNSLGTPHIFSLPETLSPGTHRLTIRVDNRVKDINVGQNSHSISDHTQSNWNGMIGKLFITARPALYVDDIQVYPDIRNKQVRVKLKINNLTHRATTANLRLLALSSDAKAEKLQAVNQPVNIGENGLETELVYPMGKQPLLWDEFHPNLYTLQVELNSKQGNETRATTFGMREFSTRGTQFTINGNLTFLRGTLECAIFPKTGYPPTDVDSWMRIFRICRSYGLNHMRFHSWTPPEAAFEAADRSGFYLQIENSSWANQGATIGDGKPLDQYIYDESERVVKTYGNHPSFCMMAYGNEPAGKNHKKYLTDFVTFWEKKDSRRLYTTGAGWPIVPESNYNSTPNPRIQRWGEELKSIINAQPPRSDYDWRNIISKWQHPTVSHEIGQWCVYPNFKEITRYDGVLKAKNFEIFRDKLNEHGMASLADSFLLASGKLQVLCYKADIEAALRTPGFGGFQLLDLHDFPGQGTALVGVLDPFWDDKGYVTGAEYSRFCNSTVPLALFPKMIYQNNEELAVPVEIAHFGVMSLKDVVPTWTIKDASGKVLSEGKLPKTDIPLGNTIPLGEIRQSLSAIKQATQLLVTVSVGKYENSWDIFVYPSALPETKGNILITQQLDDKAIATLNRGGNVLLTLKKGSVKPDKGGNVKLGFSSIFWNTAWTRGQGPTTLGILCNPKHPALRNFPTQYHSNWQWWDAVTHASTIKLDEVSPDLQPIVRVIDDWFTAKPLGLIFECRIGKGKLLVSGIDLLTDAENRPEARQLLYSLKNYMAGGQFNPAAQVDLQRIKALVE
ncbi:beta-galactosidase [Pedobacter sp. BS3]|uniref:sugar-binding domain-containing protein n=1 Tax=Pedobacter sp. BS3 TaxID=2567937 RepID=UPI0011F016F9|nr:sugar-binding domain-containing protein [Pedobacter sp. BS3]TZF82671.1 beta-galactosidase [Pedobacter sp. BS3]